MERGDGIFIGFTADECAALALAIDERTAWIRRHLAGVDRDAVSGMGTGEEVARVHRELAAEHVMLTELGDRIYRAMRKELVA